MPDRVSKLYVFMDEKDDLMIAGPCEVKALLRDKCTHRLSDCVIMPKAELDAKLAAARQEGRTKPLVADGNAADMEAIDEMVDKDAVDKVMGGNARSAAAKRREAAKKAKVAEAGKGD